MATGNFINSEVQCSRPRELSDVSRSSSYVPLRPTTHVDAAEQGGQVLDGHGFPGPAAEVQEEPSHLLGARARWMA